MTAPHAERKPRPRGRHGRASLPAGLLVGFALWIAYGVAGRDLPLVIPNTVAFLVMAYTIIVAVGYRH